MIWMDYVLLLWIDFININVLDYNDMMYYCYGPIILMVQYQYFYYILL